MSNLTNGMLRYIREETLLDPMIDYLNRCKQASEPCTIRSKSQLSASALVECEGGDNFPCSLCARPHAATDPKLMHVQGRHDLVCVDCRDQLKDSTEEMNITAERMLRRMMMRSISFPVPERVTFRNMIVPQWCEICLSRTTPIRCVQLPVSNRCVMVCNLGCEVLKQQPQFITNPVALPDWEPSVSIEQIVSVDDAAKVRQKNPNFAVLNCSNSFMLRVLQMPIVEEQSIYKSVSADLQWFRENFVPVDVSQNLTVFKKKE